MRYITAAATGHFYLAQYLARLFQQHDLHTRVQPGGVYRAKIPPRRRRQ